MTAYVFVPLLAMTWVVGLAVVSHAGQYFLSIVESSATGMAQNVVMRGRSFRDWIRDGIDWPDEPFADYILKGVFLAYMAVLWAGPAFLIGRAATEDPVQRLAITGTIFWLFFPIGILSALASGSRWNPLWPGLFAGFARRPVQTLGFYLLSAPVLAVLVLTVDAVLLRSADVPTTWALALAPVGVLAFFIYARLVGRLGLVLSYSLPEVEERKPTPRPRKRKPRRPVDAYDERHRFGVPTEEIPDDTPKLIAPYGGEEITGYGVDVDGTMPLEEPAKPAPATNLWDDEDNSPIGVEPLPDGSQPARPVLPERLANPPEHEVALYLSSRPTEPQNPYGSESVTFLFDPKTIEPWIRLTAGVILLALMQRALDGMRPE